MAELICKHKNWNKLFKLQTEIVTKQGHLFLVAIKLNHIIYEEKTSN